MIKDDEIVEMLPVILGAIVAKSSVALYDDILIRMRYKVPYYVYVYIYVYIYIFII